MKTIFFALVLALAGLESWAQTPPPAAPAMPAIPRTRPPRFGVTNVPSTQPRYPVTGQGLPGTVAPGAPGASLPGAGLPGAVAPTASQASAAASEAALLNARPEETINAGMINFQGVDVNQVLEVYAKLVNRTLLRSTLPDAKIILKSQTDLTKTEAIQALQAVLSMNNISVVNIGEKFVKVMPVDQANTAAAELDRSGSTNLPSLGSYVTHIAQLKFVKPSEMVPVITPFSKLANSILPIDANGILVLRDNAENVKRMLEMIAQIDVSVPAEYISEVIPIRYAKVADIAAALNGLGGGGSGVSAGIGSSSSSGTINGFSGNRSSGGMGGMGGMGGGTSSGIGSGLGGGMNRAGTTANTANGTANNATSFQQRISNLLNKATGTGAPGQAGQDIQLFGQTKIIPNESSSSLLIYATRADMEVIKGIIGKLDVPLPQVLIEAVIMNVKIGSTFNFGVSAAQKPQNYNSSLPVNGAGGMQNGSFMSIVQSVSTNGTSLASSVNTNSAFGNSLPGGASWFGNIGPNWDVIITAAQSDNNASIIQRPRIQTSQAKPAQFFVGDTVPYVTGNTYGSTYGNSSSYSQLSVGVELDVTPYINPDGLVVMEIMQEIDDLNGYTLIENVGNVPNTIKRTLNAEIAVRDRDTVMLGGFIKSDKTHTSSGVPFLSDIPLLGNLFKQRSDSKDRQELIVLVRPTVLKTPDLAAKNTVKEQQRLPGISAASAEDTEYERKLIDAERKREQKKFKKNKQYDGFYTPEPDASETNSLPVEAPIEQPPTAPATPKAGTTSPTGQTQILTK